MEGEVPFREGNRSERVIDRRLSGAATSGLSLDGKVESEHGSHSFMKIYCRDAELKCKNSMPHYHSLCFKVDANSLRTGQASK